MHKFKMEPTFLCNLTKKVSLVCCGFIELINQVEKYLQQNEQKHGANRTFLVQTTK